MTGGSSDVETLAASSEGHYGDYEHQDRDGDDETAADVVPRSVQGFERPNGAVHDAGDECEKDRECWRHSEKLFHRFILLEFPLIGILRCILNESTTKKDRESPKHEQ